MAKISPISQATIKHQPPERGNPPLSGLVGMITGVCHHLDEVQPNKRRVVLITFIEEDNKGVLFPFNDSIVVTINVENYDVHYILIDNRSLANVLYYDSLMKMGIYLHW